MVVSARRAAEVEEDAVVELPTHTSPRRGDPQAARPRAVRLVLAPLAALTVVGLIVGGALLPLGKGSVERADPDVVVIPVTTFTPERLLRPSRSETQTQPPLAAATPVEPQPSTPTLPAAPEPTASATPSAKKAEPKQGKVSKASRDEARAARAKAKDEKRKAALAGYAKLGETDGKLYAKSAVNVRRGPGPQHDVRTTVGQGETVVITERVIDGWRQVVWNDRAGWVKASFLTDTKPKPERRTDRASRKGSKDSGFSSATCPKAGGLEKNLTSRTAAVLRAVCAKFPAVRSYGGYRPGDSGYHGSGRAIDIMISGEAGWEIARWARANAGSLGVVEVIYEQKIWTTQRSGDGWRSMSDRGGATANHYDHVHLSVR
ncbi:MAG: SH3 domain-containing protein [Tessaracoccus sp.]|uniref:SH3 domain-containing protein n=1 Tax=Tessaracoccus sp. TaxID=1971211 RepID=UPI001EC9746D|nr:SH3 domain-containing protein [Tessaracoccus sp.]MBK7822466.1 SH3 domain-containing protein [Tessaracoccus sp.]